MEDNYLDYIARLSITLPSFKYIDAKSVEEACTLLLQFKGDARVIAGGTDLIVQMRDQKLRPPCVINLKSIPGLDTIKSNGKKVHIGSLSTMSDIARSPVILEFLPLLARAAHWVGTPQVRNVATIGGNLGNASPAADTAPSLLVLNAEVEMTGTNGKRTILLEDFFRGPNATILKDDEIITGLQVPHPPADSGCIYVKLPARTAIDLATASVAVIITLSDSKVGNARIALGAVANKPFRARKAEKIITGKSLNDALLDEVAQAASDEASPITDVRGTAEYRRQVVKVLTTRAIKEATRMVR